MLQRLKLAKYLAQRIDEKWAYSVQDDEGRDDIANDFSMANYYVDWVLQEATMLEDWKRLFECIWVADLLSIYIKEDTLFLENVPVNTIINNLSDLFYSLMFTYEISPKK